MSKLLQARLAWANSSGITVLVCVWQDLVPVWTGSGCWAHCWFPQTHKELTSLPSETKGQMIAHPWPGRLSNPLQFQRTREKRRWKRKSRCLEMKAKPTKGYHIILVRHSYCAHCLAAAVAACPRTTQDWGHQSSIDQVRIHRALSDCADLVLLVELGQRRSPSLAKPTSDPLRCWVVVQNPWSPRQCQINPRGDMMEHNDVKRICREQVGWHKWERNRRRRRENRQTHSIHTMKLAKI